MALLSEIETGKSVLVKKVLGRSSFRRRISEMGFVQGKEVFVLKNAPFRDPIEYKIMGYNVSLRRSEAALIEVVETNNAEEVSSPFNGTLTIDKEKISGKNKRKHIHVALVGNPNAGKTSLFNSMTGRQEHVGNYSGVTIDAKKSRIKWKNYYIDITDLPGTYSISPNSPDEIFVRDHILKEHPDMVINVVDASNLERNLYLTCQLIDMDIQMILALNMYDELERSGDKFDRDTFAQITGIPVIPTVGSKKQGIDHLIEKIVEVYENEDPILRHIHINYGQELEQSINRIQKEIWKADNYIREFSSRYFALRLLEKDKHTEQNIKVYNNSENIVKLAKDEIQRLENLLKEDSDTLITNARYGFIEGALKETYISKASRENSSVSQRIDSILTGKFTGFPLFLLALWIMFQTTFKLGAYPADWIDMGISWLGNALGNLIEPGPLHALLIDGVIGGVGGVLVFLPNIVILFFFISLMEDTGYMSRVAFIMDKLMHLIGLHGKSFIPLIMGFGCNVPAIMATRTLENRSDRLLTMLILPFMSCSARLPVYILIAGAIFPAQAGNIIFLIYLTGILLSILTAILLKKTMFRSIEAPFVMELPPYRIPTIQSALRHMWNKAGQYLKKMGGIILWASVIVWFLSYFPRSNDKIKVLEEQLVQYESSLNATNTDIAGLSFSEEEVKAKIHLIETEISEVQLANSYIGRTGKFIEPVLRPIGFDWKIGVSLLTGIVAKEIVVSTMGVLYAETAPDGNPVNLKDALPKQKFTQGNKIGEPIYAEPTTLALLVFVLIYVPCVAVIAAIHREAGSWKYSLWSITYSTALAWAVALLVSKVATFFF